MLLPFLFFFFDEAPDPQLWNLPPGELWYFLPFGYLFTIIAETAILLFGLSQKVSIRQKILCGIWLTACTYPVVVLVLPIVLASFSRDLYLVVAEIFAPAAECLLFWLAFRGNKEFSNGDWIRSFIAIALANLASFLLGEVMHSFSWFGLLEWN